MIKTVMIAQRKYKNAFHHSLETSYMRRIVGGLIFGFNRLIFGVPRLPTEFNRIFVQLFCHCCVHLEYCKLYKR